MAHPIARRCRTLSVVAGALLMGVLGFASVASADEIAPGDPKPAATTTTQAERAQHAQRVTRNESRSSTNQLRSLPRISRGGMPRNMPQISRH